MTDEEKKYIDIFINKCEKYDESVEVKGVSVGEESRILDTVVKYLKLIEKQQAEIEKYKQLYEKALNDLVISEHDKLKKNRIIDAMADKIKEEGIIWDNKQEIIEYFTNKVKEKCDK